MVRLLASVPSVIYGLIGVLVLVPFIGNHLISQHAKASVTPVISLSGYSLLAAVVILTVMISPIMIAIFAEGLRSVPARLARGLARARRQPLAHVLEDRRADRPAGAGRRHRAGDRAGARRVGDAEHGRRARSRFAPNPADGLIFFVEPSRGLAATILHNTDELTSPPMKHTLFAIAAVLLFSSAMLSLAGWAAKQPMKRYFNVGGAAA